MRKKAMRNVSIMTELSTEKVELGLVDELKKEVAEIEKQVSAQKTLYKNTEKQYDLYIKLLAEKVLGIEVITENIKF